MKKKILSIPVADMIAGLPPMLTVQEVADFLRCSTRTVARYKRSGRLPFKFEIAGHTARTVFKKEDVGVLLEEKRRAEGLTRVQITRAELAALKRKAGVV